ncbi:hypothetical protein TNCV_321441 [Trichonephila clavipes]|nr:hypothetical protein TNCV_321441 [Trichonephila clavipes]
MTNARCQYEFTTPKTRMQPSWCCKQNLHSSEKKNTSCHCVPRFDVDPIIDDSPVCDSASRVATALVSKLRVHATTNVIELFVKALVVLQTTPILDSRLVRGLNDPLRS